MASFLVKLKQQNYLNQRDTGWTIKIFFTRSFCSIVPGKLCFGKNPVAVDTVTTYMLKHFFSLSQRDLFMQ